MKFSRSLKVLHALIQGSPACLGIRSQPTSHLSGQPASCAQRLIDRKIHRQALYKTVIEHHFQPLNTSNKTKNKVVHRPDRASWTSQVHHLPVSYIYFNIYFLYHYLLLRALLSLLERGEGVYLAWMFFFYTHRSIMRYFRATSKFERLEGISWMGPILSTSRVDGAAAWRPLIA